MTIHFSVIIMLLPSDNIYVIHDENTYTLSVICRAFNNDEDDEFAIENDHSKLTPATTCRLNRECIIMIYEPENLNWTEATPR